MKFQRRSGVGLLVLLGLCCQICPPESLAQCSPEEKVATFVVEGVLAGEEMSLSRLFVATHGDESYPSDEQMIESIGFSYPHSIWKLVEFEKHSVFYAAPFDFGVEAIIDRRSGAIAYHASIAWWGGGSIQFPASSNHGWSIDSSNTASPPATISVAADAYWYAEGNGEPQDIATSILEYLRTTDVFESFASCGDYSAVCYLAVPGPQGFPDPPYAVVVVNGHCGPPWNDAPVSTESASWGSVKGLFR